MKRHLEHTLSTPLTVELAQTQDLDELLVVARQAFTETYEPIGVKPAGIVRRYVEETFTREWLLPQLGDYFVAKVGGKIVGFAGLDARTEVPVSVADSNAIYFSGLYLLQGFQGLGLGRKFFEARSRHALARGFTSAWLSVWRLNAGAVEFHRRMGFEVVGEQEWRYEADGETWICEDWVMRIRLDASSQGSAFV